MGFNALVFIVAAVAGGVAAIAGFGIGSLLTPLLAQHHDMKLAVALVSVSHRAGTVARFLPLKQHVDRRVFWNFGILRAAVGLGGALLHSRANSPALSIVFGVLLLFAGLSGLAGWAQRMRFGRKSAWMPALCPACSADCRRRGMPKYNPGHWQVFRQLALPTNPVTLTTNPAFRVPLAHRLA